MDRKFLVMADYISGIAKISEQHELYMYWI
jgi:hypothetical protein